MTHSYDDQNIFAKILRGEIPNKTIRETAHTLAFHDIRPLAPVHALVIPKGRYVTFDDFAAKATAEEFHDFHRTCAAVIEELGLVKGGGYRVIANALHHGGQEVPHYHLHILGGQGLGPMLSRG